MSCFGLTTSSGTTDDSSLGTLGCRIANLEPRPRSVLPSDSNTEKSTLASSPKFSDSNIPSSTVLGLGDSTLFGATTADGCFTTTATSFFFLLNKLKNPFFSTGLLTSFDGSTTGIGTTSLIPSTGTLTDCSPYFSLSVPTGKEATSSSNCDLTFSTCRLTT